MKVLQWASEDRTWGSKWWKVLFHSRPYLRGGTRNFLFFIMSYSIWSIPFSACQYGGLSNFTLDRVSGACFLLASSYYCDLAEAKNISGIRHGILVEQPCIWCMACSIRFATLVLPKQHQTVYTKEIQSLPFKKLDHVWKWREKQHASESREEISRAVHLLAKWFLSSLHCFWEMRIIDGMILKDYVFEGYRWTTSKYLSSNTQAPENLLYKIPVSVMTANKAETRRVLHPTRRCSVKNGLFAFM